MPRTPVHKKPKNEEDERRKMEERVSNMTTTPNERHSSRSKVKTDKKTSKRKRKRDPIQDNGIEENDEGFVMVKVGSNKKGPIWGLPSERESKQRGKRVSIRSKDSKDSSLNSRRGHPPPILQNRSENDGEPSFLPVPKKDRDIAEHYADTITTALEHFGLTGKAKEMIEAGLQGDVVEVNVSEVVEALTKLTASPLQGVLEANRVGALGQLYDAAEETLTSLQEELRDDELSVKQKLKLLDLVYLRIKTLSGDVGGPSSPGTGLRPGEVELSEKRTVKVNLGTRTGRRKVDKMLQEPERPDGDYLIDYE